MQLTKVSEVQTGGWTQGITFSPDGQTVLVQNTTQKEIKATAIDGAHATDIGQRLRFDSAPSGMRAMNTQQRENGN